MRLRCAAVLAVLALAAPAAARDAVLVDRIVAVVNKDVITLTELAARTELAERELQRRQIAAPPRAVLQRQVLERLVLDKAQVQLAEQTGLRVDELQLDRAVQRVAHSNNMTLPDFRRALERDGVSFERFRADMRQQMLQSRLREREVDDRVQVSEAEIDLYLEDNRAGAEGAVEYELAHILVRVPEQARPDQVAQAGERAERVRTEAAAGGDFAKLAAAYSDAGDALQGGALGWRAPGRLPEIFAQALEGMKAGEVSATLRSPAGFHVLKLLGKRGAGTAAPVVQTRARHILVKTNEVVSEEDARRRLITLRDRILTGADFAELAKLGSEDGTAALGGDLGWLYPGDTVPEFERAMNALQPGEISPPVRTPFGFHLIRVEERRAADVSAERQRQQARQALRERKAEEAYQDWLRQLRDRTYVELRLDER
ncbi:MAG: peptidylprolyl isomerase [Betaproteobacteria bacterium]|nr:peptidylprolyl isomerase [Betaproteobacteria bacterium]MDH5221418.1 peptidylprolyl isomerase [Betaproteobacteria bacterium]MDH5351717.1 peptidylprolyl isomerase [Betaproteobacteria bacterium]